MRVILCGLAEARKEITFGAFTVLRNMVVQGKKLFLITTARDCSLSYSGEPQSQYCSISAQAIADAGFYQIFRLSLQEILTGGCGQGMPLLMYRQSEVYA